MYTCPMHPDVRQASAGDCPICGMALEQETPSDEKIVNQELVDFERRFWVSLMLTVPVIFLGMTSVFIFNTTYIEAALTLPVVLWGGWPFFKRAGQSIKNRTLNMFTLIAMGTGITLIYSLVAMFYRLPVYFEVAASIIVLVLLGQVLEIRAREKTGKAIEALLSLTPNFAHRLTKTGIEDVLIDKINIGDKLRILPGEKIPVDGIVFEGESTVDESMLTGEPMPVTKTKNLKLIAGTINGAGVFVMVAKKIGQDTLLAQMIRLISEAQRSRAPVQKLVDTVAAYFVPIVILIATLSLMIWALILPYPEGFTQGLIAAVSVLMIACPCALGLATPMSIMVGIGRGARLGILIKNAESLLALQKVDTLIFDKTGTLTLGHPKLTNVLASEGFKEKTLLTYAAALEAHSEHPLGQAILNEAEEKALKHPKTKHIKILPGQGVTGEINHKKIMLGNLKLMHTAHIDTCIFDTEADRLAQMGNTLIFMAIDEQIAGLFVVSDPIKPATPDAIQALEKLGLNSIMLTGDTLMTAEAYAHQLGIEKVYADVLPDEKHKIIKKYHKKNCVIAMIGDGINDAPALAAADVGIAMGTGSDIAMETAGVTLLKGDLTSLVPAIQLSRAVMQNIRQNLFFAFFYNALGIPIAAGLLYPWFGIQLSPIFAAAAMSLSSLSVVLNALKLNFKKLDLQKKDDGGMLNTA